MSKSSKRAKSSNRDMRVIYPEYFDKNLSWRMGRRVPLRIAYEDPELKRVALAAQKAGYEVFLDSNKNYSSTWYDRKGRMLIRKVGTKEEQIREIAKNIPKVNLPKPTEKKEPSQKKQKKGSVYRQKTR
ncbi:MAG TPA: signal recognition particle subunit SRP19/SEC65 family protein [candidate division Zixibacteria bacterium]|nr:signal recognition particle subunit SRP19/SEC65 family protein [candidate division Zixibacteria bacterium]